MRVYEIIKYKALAYERCEESGKLRIKITRLLRVDELNIYAMYDYNLNLISAKMLVFDQKPLLRFY